MCFNRGIFFLRKNIVQVIKENKIWVNIISNQINPNISQWHITQVRYLANQYFNPSIGKGRAYIYFKGKGFQKEGQNKINGFSREKEPKHLRDLLNTILIPRVFPAFGKRSLLDRCDWLKQMQLWEVKWSAVFVRVTWKLILRRLYLGQTPFFFFYFSDTLRSFS